MRIRVRTVDVNPDLDPPCINGRLACADRIVFILFGARGTGKSTLLRALFADVDTLWIDLLRPELEDRYARQPELLYEEIKGRQAHLEWVVIDEVQKLPRLLDTVHRCIESDEFKPPRFALTGSSTRKLKHGGANLLAGRAFVKHLHPLAKFRVECCI